MKSALPAAAAHRISDSIAAAGVVGGWVLHP